MSWFHTLTAQLTARWWRLKDIQEDTRATRVLLEGIPAQLTRMETAMADTSALLNEVADGLNGLGQPVADLIAENTRLATENAELRGENAGLVGEDVAESAAAERVRESFDSLAAKFDVPEVPVDVEPLPEPAPVDMGELPPAA